ncbi:unnamed protein product [Medioppia subpectinata]|uniref:Uncharacterized protein n=1 Tax=Medioppia subpectinata TaxID=1979941 RepID=A0A7R9LKJ1_9ACAR|nr:unnamed protein product [Medioppia subpectinata]CAG2119619.1 unnamed protein product [Medioppia subpectinata]
MRKFCGSLLSFLVVMAISFAAAIAVAAIVSNLSSNWKPDDKTQLDPRPRLFAILNMFSVCIRRIFHQPSAWASFPIGSKCACIKWPCDKNDPCHPGFDYSLTGS